ncbi:3D domain-containing protein [Sabulilitoribacter multivorans]|uniref:3D domain-containing protein n=1 Tax=Flaviramulus multivorans TaxID=1304750 RepID=A0ABS9IJB6_9FLAO|nr:3D domain-containing protein [Flaviramulus multivorans]MCF7560685.1 3D domain-containing protein [Flaviramulus multivorans]
MRWPIFVLILCIVGCKKEPNFEEDYDWNSRIVMASAYNSLAYQTSSNPHITAFGDSLKPGLKYIAVSRDLLRKGLKHNTPVKIEGFKGVFFVKDKMNVRYKNHIDIYMGVDVKAAKQWGRRMVCIDYGIPKAD